MTSHILFYSKSKSDIGKLLSNFSKSEIEILDVKFKSVENAFQACKFLLTNKPEIFEKLTNVSPLEAKQMGSKSGMKKLGCEIDIECWNKYNVMIMESLLMGGYVFDKQFQNTIDELNANNVLLYHFERSGAKLFWGGYINKDGKFVGNNMLGKILM